MPQKKRDFKGTGLTQVSKATADPDSTWYKDHNIREMKERTDAFIAKLEEERKARESQVQK